MFWLVVFSMFVIPQFIVGALGRNHRLNGVFIGGTLAVGGGLVVLAFDSLAFLAHNWGGARNMTGWQFFYLVAATILAGIAAWSACTKSWNYTYQQSDIPRLQGVLRAILLGNVAAVVTQLAFMKIFGL